MKIATIIGARPQFIKAAMVSRAFKAFPDIKEIVVHTGQHYDPQMSDIFFDELSMERPQFALHVQGRSHGTQTAQMLAAIESVLLDQKPDCVLVYGDTNTTLAGALCAAKLHHPIVHVEAGLRSFNRKMPEEINRIVTDHLSDLLFAPTETAVQNLHREGIAENKVHRVGDVMYDAAIYYGDRAQNTSHVLERLALPRKSYILATIHRAENTDSLSNLRSILEGLSAVSKEIPVVLPLHPRTKQSLGQALDLNSLCDSLIITEPLGYLDMIMLEKNAALIATDSGGVQKEAFFHRVPCATLRNETEWVELVDLGWNRLAPPTSAQAVAAEILQQLGKSPNSIAYPYGDGHAAEHIAAVLLATIGRRTSALPERSKHAVAGFTSAVPSFHLQAAREQS